MAMWGVPLPLPAASGSRMRIFLYAHDVDMRKSFDGLHGIVQREFGADVCAGDAFLFLNRRRDRLKLFFWDRDGLVIFAKRLERGTFERPAAPPLANHVEIDGVQWALLLTGIELSSVKRRRRYLVASRPVAAAGSVLR